MPSLKQATETAILVRASILSGLCSIVPFPFLDDILLARVRKGVVKRELRVHQSGLSAKQLKPVYAGLSRGCLERVVGLFVGLITKTIRKLLRTVFFFLAVRSAALEMVETFLIGRTVSRCLEKGILTELDDADEDAQHERAEQIREALDMASAGTDRKALAHAMRQGWRAMGGLRSSAFSIGRRFRKGKVDDEIQPEDLSTDEQATVREGERVIEQEVENDEVQRFLVQFDARFDAALAELDANG